MSFCYERALSRGIPAFLGNRVCISVCTGVCVRVRVNVRVWRHLLDTCRTVLCPAAIVLVIVYHFLPIFFVFFFIPPLSRFFLFFVFYFISSLCVGGVARSCPNAPPTSVTSGLALSNPISCWWRGWMRRWSLREWCRLSSHCPPTLKCKWNHDDKPRRVSLPPSLHWVRTNPSQSVPARSQDTLTKLSELLFYFSWSPLGLGCRHSVVHSGCAESLFLGVGSSA